MAGDGHPVWRLDQDGRLMEMSVFADVAGSPVLAGTLTFQSGRRGGSRVGTFRYDPDWLADSAAHPLFASGLPLRKRGIQGDPPHEIPLPFYDASPDGWGKTILSLAYPDVDLHAPEFIAAAGDDRIGHLQFGPDAESPLVWVPSPSMLDIPRSDDSLTDLLDAADAVEDGVATRSHLAKLLDSGADIGGARPKARIVDNGVSYIVKTRANGDAFDHQTVEAACLSVARAAGIEVPDHAVRQIGGRSALLVERFDRRGSCRLPYTSAATILGYPPSTHRPESASYVDLALQARRQGIVDCSRELFARMLLNCFLNNTDDHLHNHGFIYSDGHWRLSPLFDVVPQARRALVLRPARGASAGADPYAAVEHHEQFGLSKRQADDILEQVRTACGLFRHCMAHYGTSLEDMETVLRLAPHAADAPEQVESASLQP